MLNGNLFLNIYLAAYINIELNGLFGPSIRAAVLQQIHASLGMWGLRFGNNLGNGEAVLNRIQLANFFKITVDAGKPGLGKKLLVKIPSPHFNI